MDCLVRQKAYRLFIPWQRLGQSSDERAAIEPSVEGVGGRGGSRSHGLWRRIFTSNEGSPHFERHRGFADGSSALGPCANREHSEVSRSQNKGRPDSGLSSLRHLTVSVAHRHMPFDPRLWRRSKHKYRHTCSLGSRRDAGFTCRMRTYRWLVSWG